MNNPVTKSYEDTDYRIRDNFPELLLSVVSILVVGPDNEDVQFMLRGALEKNGSDIDIKYVPQLDTITTGGLGNFDCVIISFNNLNTRYGDFENALHSATQLANQWIFISVDNSTFEISDATQKNKSGKTLTNSVDKMRSLGFEVFGTLGPKLPNYIFKFNSFSKKFLRKPLRNILWRHPRRSNRLIGLKRPYETLGFYYNNQRNEMSDYIPESTKRILDIGCGAGNFGATLKKKMELEIWGVEYSKEAAQIASGRLDKVITGDVSHAIPDLPKDYFDCIIFNDVLEHLVDPYSLLPSVKDLLSRDGVIIASIPNVRHTSVLWNLLFRKEWEYADYGVLDRTHLRFFTKKSILRMFSDSGYVCSRINGINSEITPHFLLLNVLLFGSALDARFTQYSCTFTRK